MHGRMTAGMTHHGIWVLLAGDDVLRATAIDEFPLGPFLEIEFPRELERHGGLDLMRFEFGVIIGELVV